MPSRGLDTLLRILGVVLPSALLGIYGALGDYGWWTLVVYIAGGFVGGLLIRTWWSVVIVPIAMAAALLAWVAISSGLHGLIEDLGILGLVFLWTLWVIFPIAIAAVIGMFIGKLIEKSISRSAAG